MHHLDLDTITLKSGGHQDRDQGVCLLEAVAWWADEPHSDTPACVDQTLARFGRAWNDAMRDDDERAQLRRYVPALVGTAGTSDDSVRRAWLALDWLVRVSTPAWLDLAGLADEAQRLRDLPQVTEVDDAVLAALWDGRAKAAAAGDAAGAAAGAAAGDAAKAAAGDAARDAARAAAWDAARAAARAAAGAAAWAAAGAAAGAAAWDAARAAARAAAGDAAKAAAGDAARDAARDALAPTVTTLQSSAHDLYLAMIVAGPHDPDAVAAMPAVGVQA
jgi:hypothetical protein